jgi:ATP-dependent DNA helicase RecG
MERLKVFEKTQDGFEVAVHATKLRGIGVLSLGSSKKSGADETFLFGRPVSVDALDSVMQMLDKFGGVG